LVAGALQPFTVAGKCGYLRIRWMNPGGPMTKKNGKPKYIKLQELCRPSPFEGQRCVKVKETGWSIRLPSSSAEAMTKPTACPNCNKPVQPPCEGISHSQHKRQQVELKLMKPGPSPYFIGLVTVLGIIAVIAGSYGASIETPPASAASASAAPGPQPSAPSAAPSRRQ